MFKQESTINIPEHLLFDAIKLGVKEAFQETLKTDQVIEAIKNGVQESHLKNEKN
jgi:hypothetical protein